MRRPLAVMRKRWWPGGGPPDSGGKRGGTRTVHARLTGPDIHMMSPDRWSCLCEAVSGSTVLGV